MQKVVRVPPRYLAAAVVALADLVFYVFAFRHTWIDDTYIQLQYARTLIEHGTWGFYAGHPANTATSPLNVLLIALVGLPLGSVEWAVILLTALELAAMLGLLLLLSHRLFDGVFFGWFAFVALVTNPLLLSTIGMESFLYALLLIASVYLFLVRRWLLMAVTLGLLTLARPDGVLLLAVLLPLAEIPFRRKAAVLGVYAATIAPWFIFSWIYLGSLVPDTLVIKIEQTAWGWASFADGLALYLQRFPLETMLSLLLVPLCIFPLWRCGGEIVRTVTVLAAFGGLHYMVYTALDVPPYHWYYVSQLVPMVLIASVAATHHVARLRQGRFRRVLPVVALAPAAGLLLLLGNEGFSLREAPINTNWATSDQYREIGLWMQRNLDEEEAVAPRGEIGTLAFYSDRYLVDEFSDMSIADALIDEANYDDLPVVGPLVALNFLWRQDHTPLPAPSFEVVYERKANGSQCPTDDPACWLARTGTTEWIGQNRILVRAIA